MSTFLQYVHCKDALLDCSAPGGERCESLTWVDEISIYTVWGHQLTFCMPVGAFDSYCVFSDIENSDLDHFSLSKFPDIPLMSIKYVLLVNSSRSITIIDWSRWWLFLSWLFRYYSSEVSNIEYVLLIDVPFICHDFILPWLYIEFSPMDMMGKVILKNVFLIWFLSVIS